jgi:hypothetical protein
VEGNRGGCDLLKLLIFAALNFRILTPYAYILTYTFFQTHVIYGYYVMECGTMSSGRSLRRLRRNVRCSFSGLKSKSSIQMAVSPVYTFKASFLVLNKLSNIP